MIVLRSDRLIQLCFGQFENSLRRHNHIGLVHALLVGLAKAGQLSSATENARKVMRERVARRREMGLGDMDED